MRYVLSFLFAAAIVVTSATSSAAQNPPQPGLPEEASQLDFWLGTWKVGTTGAGIDKVKRLGDGVAIFEKYEFGSQKGWSINVFDSTTQTWTQTWHTNAGVY